MIEKATEPSQALLLGMINSISDVIYFKNIEGVYLACNENFPKFLGCNLGEIPGKTDYDLLPYDLAVSFHVNDRQVFSSHTPQRYDEWINFPKNQRILLNIQKTPYFSPNGDLLGLIGVWRNITKSRQTVKDLQESERKLSTLMGNLPGMAYSCLNDENWTMTFVSDGCLALTGYQPNDLIDNRRVTYNDLIHPDDQHQVWDAVQSDLALKRSFQMTYRITTASGKKKWVWEQGTGVFTENGSLLGLEGFITDVSRQKQAEEDIRKLNAELEERVWLRTAELESANKILDQRAQELEKAKIEAEAATEAKGSFLARMSHEIRTPMNAVIGLTNLALKTDLDATQKDFLLKVDESAQHLLSIINDILDFSKIEADKLVLDCSEFMLHHVVEKIANMFRVQAEEKEIELFYIIGGDVPLILKGDPMRVGQVLINVVANAVKFTKRGEVVIRIAEDPQQTRTGHAKTVNLLFSIQDSGIGIRKEEITGLFEPFTQTDGSVRRGYEGTGLGLSICQRLVKLMGGKIWAESKPGRGSTFYFTLSLERADELRQQALTSPPDVRGMKVLVVDDNPIARDIMEEILQGFDFQVTSVSSAQEGLAQLTKAALDRPYSLVVVDWKMPDFDGFQLAEHIRKHPLLSKKDKSPRIIMVTMYARDEFLRQQLSTDADINAYLSKPVSSSELFNTIMEVFGQKDAMVPRLVLGQEAATLIDGDKYWCSSNRLNKHVLIS